MARRVTTTTPSPYPCPYPSHLSPRRHLNPSTGSSMSVTNQIRKIFTRAGLDNTGLTPESLRRWAALRDVTDAATLFAGAERYGTGWLTLYRRIHNLGDRALSRTA